MSQDTSSQADDVLSSEVTSTEPSSTSPHKSPQLLYQWGLALLTFLLLLWLIPQWQVSGLQLSPKDRLLMANALRDTWATIFAALFFASACYFTWRHVDAIGKTVVAAERTTAAAEKSAAISSERHITERFVRVMELLGDEKLEVRLGGIYALERIARDSPNDQTAVTEVFATYIREHATWNREAATAPRLRSDIQAILTVLGRRTWASREDESLDLHATALATAYLPFARLQRAFLYEADLRGAMLYNADLRGAWLWKAHLHNAILEGAHLEGADLTAAEGLTWEQLEQAHLDKTTKIPDYLRSSAPDHAFDPKRLIVPTSSPDPEEELPTKRSDHEMLPSKNA
jgi:hypothetical protein